MEAAAMWPFWDHYQQNMAARNTVTAWIMLAQSFPTHAFDDLHTNRADKQHNL
jgi:hypothetical protein